MQRSSGVHHPALARIFAPTSARFPTTPREANGVKISGTRGGSPAEKAGLMGGDIIVEFAGQKIANIYDYTYALDAVTIGKEIRIVVRRDGKLVTLSATPEARK